MLNTYNPSSITFNANHNQIAPIDIKQDSNFLNQFSLDKVKRYGPAGIATYLAVSWPILGLIYMGVSRSGKASNIIKYFNLQNKVSPKAGSFAVSYVLYKMLIPVRLAITIAVIPTVLQKFDIKVSTQGDNLVQNEQKGQESKEGLVAKTEESPKDLLLGDAGIGSR